VPLGSTYPTTEGKPGIFLRGRSGRSVKKDLPYSVLDLRLLKTFRPLLVCLSEVMFKQGDLTSILRNLQNCEKQLLASSCLKVPPFVHIEHIGSHCTEFHKNLYMDVCRKSVKRIQV